MIRRMPSEVRPYTSGNGHGPGNVAASLVQHDYEIEGVVGNSAFYSLCIGVHRIPGWGRATLCELLRELIGNPFRRPPTIDAACLTGTVKQLALAAYEERELPAGHLDVCRLAVLADSLEEAGCQDAELLGHCGVSRST